MATKKKKLDQLGAALTEARSKLKATKEELSDMKKKFRDFRQNKKRRPLVC